MRHFLNRRRLLQVSCASVAGLAIPSIAQSASKIAAAKHVIYLHQFGGPSSHEAFDMKPDAPEEIRGSFKPIASRVPGMQVCELLPDVAKIAHHLTVIRCMQHRMKNHNSATYYSLTGFPPPVDDIRLRDTLELFPAFGSVVDRFAPASNGMPTFVSFPYTLRDGSVTPGQHASFLGKSHNPFFFTNDPNSAEFRLPELTLPDSISLERLNNRKQLVDMIDRQTNLMEQTAIARGLDESFHKALSMLSTNKFRQAFDLNAESKKTRDRYGRTTYGQSCLLARRLIEAGAKFINVYLSSSIGGTRNGWDQHGFRGQPADPVLKEWLLPITNQTLSALISDLHERGLLKDTLVLWMGEFGRSPKINPAAGRDHWPQCYTAVMAGGGIKGGHIYGASDKIGAYPTVGQARPEDISATIYHQLGIDPETEMRDSLNRPIPISRGNVINELIA
ncbi:MAG: DUF1501 domain-containing protein [Zavarzinella sp.]